MTLKYNVAIVGATGLVGEAFLEILAQREFPINEIHAIASEDSLGQTVLFEEKSLTIELLDDFDFSTVNYAFFAVDSKIASLYVPKAAEAGCVVIDNSSQFRYNADIPLVIPEVNSSALEGYRQSNIIANPNCSTIQMLVALKPIYDQVGISRITVVTYQSVSGAGHAGVEELARQTASLLNGADIEEKVFPR